MRRLLKFAAAFGVLIVLGGAALYWFVLRTEAKPKAAILRTAVERRGPLDGMWTVFPGVATDDASSSWVGYRVAEKLVGVHQTDVGRSRTVAGTMTIKGADVSNVTMTADASKLTTDVALRDASVRNVLETTKFPSATFTLTKPIRLTSAPKPGVLVHADAVGDFTLHGVTRPVTIPVQGRWDGTHVQVIGSLPVVMADYEISIPEVPNLVVAEDHGTMEFQLFFKRTR